jgi:hypothetical protein
MATSISEKLKIKENFSLLTINAPADFKKALKGTPAGVKIITSGKSYDQIHWFVLNKTQMEKEVNKALKLLHENIVLWIYYPKGTSTLQTDLNRDKGWESLLAHGDRLTWISLVSFDDTWSVFGCRNKTEADRKKEQKPKERPIFDWVDPKTKTVRLPADLEAALQKNKKELLYFNTLAFSHKKEYIEWIITAKREETRTARIAGTIEKLGKRWKNPTTI